ncbi:hypothetical protein [Streptomyces sp. NRRL F-2580]|uniref:ATP dependent DNA ligase n=1 Tax=Streptomyces sp. NRRL F-2580 TaxID=1463841 RepID=UPI003B63D80F
MGTRPGGAGRAAGSDPFGEPRQDGRLRYLGSVGTGWSDRERADLAHLLAVAAADECPFTPRTGRGRGQVGPATPCRGSQLRHPVWHRLRPELAPGPW